MELNVWDHLAEYGLFWHIKWEGLQRGWEAYDLSQSNLCEYIPPELITKLSGFSL